MEKLIWLCILALASAGSVVAQLPEQNDVGKPPPLSRERSRQMTHDNVVSGVVIYREKKPLPATAVVTVRLMDVSRPNASAIPIGETQIVTSGKQPPFSFDFAYDREKVVAGGRYTLEAEIRDGDRLLFITERGVPVITFGKPRVVEITVVPVGKSEILSKTLSLSKYGTGSLVISGDRHLIVRAVVKVESNGRATIMLSAIDSSTPFSGKALFVDAKTVRVNVTSSGARPAGGTIEIRYNGRSLTSLASNNLTLEGQPVTLKF